MEEMIETMQPTYPSVAQSFGIMGFTILIPIIFAPIMMFKAVIGKELATLITYVFAFFTVFMLTYFIRKKKTGERAINLNLKNIKILPLIVLGMLCLGIGITDPLANLIPMPEFVKTMFLDALGDPNIYTFTTLVIVAPILEELIFRGIMLGGLLTRYSPLKSILISSLLFSFVHLNPWQFIAAMISGLFLGWIYYKTRSVVPTIIMHSVNNLVGFLAIAKYGKESIDNSLVQIAGGTVNAAVIIIGSMLVFVGSVYLLQKQFAKDEMAIISEKSLSVK